MAERHSYDFILGESGSGKSFYAYNWLIDRAASDPSGKYFLFVPEQNTLKAQREIVNLSSRHGMLNLDILSFQLLFYRIYAELGLEKPVLLDDMTRTLLLRKAALDAMNEGAIGVYGSRLSSRGFISQIRTLVSEFAQYNIDIDRLSAMEEASCDRRLKAKLSDIKEIYGRFLSYLSSRATVPEELMRLLLLHIDSSSLLSNAVIVFDGYTGFTPVQLELIKHILKKADLCRFSVAISADAEPYRFIRSDTSDLKWLSRKTIADIIDAADKVSVRQEAHRHKAIAARGELKPRITVIEAADPTDEIRKLAVNIRRDAVLDGRRYNRTAVVLSDPSGYRAILKREFSKEGIPYFMDDKAEAIGSPAVELIRAALSMITGGYRYDFVMRLLKNILVTIPAGNGTGGTVRAGENAEEGGTAEETDKESRDSIFGFDNFLRRSGIRGRRALTQAASGRLPGEISELINAVAALEDALKEAKPVSAKNEAVRGFMSQARIRERQQKLKERLMASGRVKEAAENARFLELTDRMLENLDSVLGDEEISTRDYASLLEAGFLDMKGSLVPETSDMVIAGDLKRSRLDDIDTLYIVGANDGMLPYLASGGGIFTDRERVELGKLDEDFPEALHFELAPDDRTDTSIQEFYLHSMLHKPNERLIVSYSKTGRDGKALRISASALRLVKEGARFISKGNAASDMDPEDIVSRGSALSAFALLTGEHREGSLVRGLYMALSEDKENALRAGQILKAAYHDYKKDALSGEASDALYNHMLMGSVSRIEAYESCPYAHFLKYGLRLKEREEFDLEASDIGNLFHESLDEIFRRLREEGRELTDVSEEELMGYVSGAVDQVTSGYGGEERSMLSAARNYAVRDRVLRITGKTVGALRFQESRGAFCNLGTEARFSVRDEELVLTGSIDRVDVCREPDGNRTLVKVIDYKTGNTRFDLDLCLEGIRIQLCAYMDCAVREAGTRAGAPDRAVPAGMFYYHIADPVLDHTKAAALLKKLKPEGNRSAGGDGPDGAAGQGGGHIEGRDTGDRAHAEDPLRDAARRLTFQELRLQGAVTDDPEMASLIDDSLEGLDALDEKSFRDSRVIAPGTLVFTETEFRRLMEHTRERIRKDAGEILSGNIEVRPYKYGSDTGCDYCGYGNICGFDPSGGHGCYRRIRKAKNRNGLE